MPKISIRINILTNFTVLILIVVSLLLSIQYYSNYQLASKAVDKNFQHVSKSVIGFIKRSEGKTKNILTLLSLNPEFKEVLTRETHPSLKYLIPILQNRPHTVSISIGYENNNFYEVISLDNHAQLKEKYALDTASKWAVITIIDKIKYIDFLNLNLNITKSVTGETAFQVNSRAWYTLAIATNNSITTQPYLFASTNQYGVSFAKKIPNTNTVISIDVANKNLADFLKSQNFNTQSNIIVYNTDQTIIASSQEQVPYTDKEILDFLNKTSQDNILTYTKSSQDYFVFHTDIENTKYENMGIAIIVSKKSLLEPYMQKIFNSLYIAIIFMLLAIPLVMYSTSSIVKPIKKLMQENEKIIKREFSEVIHIQTRITELDELSSSFVHMSRSIEEYQRAQKELLNSIIKLIAEAIDAKSVYTGGHCNRVPEIAEMLLRVVSDSKEGVFKNFSISSDDEWEEFHMGAWLHDCGKVTSPEYVIDKSSKLETIYNRIHEIRTRFEVLYRDAYISYLESQIKGENKKEALEQCKQKQIKLKEDFSFLALSNIGGEFMDPSKQERIKEIATQTWVRNFDDRLGLSDAELLRYKDSQATPAPYIENLLSDKNEHIVQRDNFDYDTYKKDGFTTEVPQYLYNYGEIYNLCISKGTLSNEERFKINEHIIMSIKMLEQLPFPQHLQKIPEYAGTHHETLIGTGYPRSLTKEELSIPARIMAIADIFEALTASDRPYKKAKTLSESLKIMSFMVKDKHIDSELFEVFLHSGIYLEYAKKYLKTEQINDININDYIA